jgi:glycogen synthase
MVRITHVIDLISQEKHGGAAQACYHLAEAQERLGHDVTIVSTDYESEYQKAP